MSGKTLKLQLIVLLLVFLWGYSWVVMKQASMYIAPAMFTALRSGIAFFILSALVLCQKTKTASIPLGYGIAIGLFQITGMQGFSQLALSYGDAGKVSVLTYTMPVWLTLMSGIFLKEKIKSGFYFLALFVIIGMLLLIHPWNSKTSFYSYFFAIVSGLCWAYGSVLIKKLYSIHPNVDLLKLTAFQMLITALVCGLIELFIYHPGSFIINNLSIYTVIFNGVFGSAGGWLIMAYILKKTPPGKSYLSLIFIPIVGLILSCLFLGEQLTLMEMVGIAIIVVMCILSKLIK